MRGLLLFVFAISTPTTFAATNSAADWRYGQELNVSTPGLVKLSLPAETLDKARPGLEDLRLYDDAGGELPYLIERPSPARKATRSAKSFQVALNATSTVISLETGLDQPIDGVTLESPGIGFIKSVRIEGSSDGSQWQTLVQSQPIFRQPVGASQLRIAVPPGVWPHLKITIDDQRSEAIPFQGALIHAAAAEPVPSESAPVTIGERHENPGETRLTLNLGAANLALSAIQIETDEPLFTRQLTVAVPQIMEDTIREHPLTQAAIYRIAVEGRPVSASLAIPLETQIHSRELLLLIKNDDSPPLSIKAVHAERRPVYLVFLARKTGVHHLFVGNNNCVAPRYDLAALSASLKNVTVAPLPLSPLKESSEYRSPEALAGVDEGGAPLDIGPWAFRKPIKIAQPGPQELELDPDVLSHAQSGLQDLRIMHNGKQLPYILERTSISRLLKPSVTATNDAADPKLSRWIIRVSHNALPVTRLVCVARTQLFQRDITLCEEITGERGEKYRRQLGLASWVQTPQRTLSEFALTIDTPPQGDTLLLETHNGDNPPLVLENFQLSYPVVRVLFKTKSADELSLYYGNPRAESPRYDLSLMAVQLLAADKTPAPLGAQQQLKQPSRASQPSSGTGSAVFWGILALVIVVLLTLVAKLLPKPSDPK